MPATRCLVLSVVAGVALAAGACSRAETPAAPPATSESPKDAPSTERVVGPLNPADAEALATMNDRLKEYVLLHQKIEGTLPKLPDNATPQQIDKNQRLFEQKMRDERKTGKRGDIFTPQAEPIIKRLMISVFGTPQGKLLKSSINDENPTGRVIVTVNGRYPDNIPLSNIPPQVLQTLPMLTEDMEYRFIGDNLILLDTPAHMIVDFIEDALPK